MSDYDVLAELPVRVEGYELEGHDREYPSGFTRPSTLIRLRGGGQEGLGEDVVYDVLDHIAMRDTGPVLDLSAASTFGEPPSCSASSTSSPARPPSGSLPPLPSLGLRVRRAGPRAAPGGVPLHGALGREPEPLQLRLLDPAHAFGDDSGSTSEPVRQRLSEVPGARLQARPGERLGRRS